MVSGNSEGNGTESEFTLHRRTNTLAQAVYFVFVNQNVHSYLYTGDINVEIKFCCDMKMSQLDGCHVSKENV